MVKSHHPGSASTERLPRLFSLLIACGQQRHATSTIAELCEATCRNLVEIGGFSSACVGMPWPGGLSSALSLTAAHARGALPAHWAGVEQLPGHGENIPLTWENRPLGTLYVHREDGPFLADEIAALTHVADHLAGELNARQMLVDHQAMESNLRQLSRALESSSNGVMITSATQLDHPIVYVNPAFERITGYFSAEVIGQSGRFLVRDDLNQKGLNDIRDALRNRNEAHAILRNYRKDGSMFWNELHIAPVRDEQGGLTTHFVSVINDVSARINYEQQLEYHATHDVLTGLANRALLNDRIAQAIALSKRDKRLMAILLLDLDRFKLINDGFGHLPADNLLKAVGERLVASVRDTDTVGRMGGDEFVVVVTDIHDAQDISLIAAKILRALAQPLSIDNKELFVTASIGIAVYPRDGEHGEALLRNADVAMYRVKENGRNSYRFYTPEMSHMALDRLDMEGNLRRALERDELIVHYQPFLDVATGRIVGAEALVRWNHPRIGLIHPTEFIPLAEDTGLIIPLGELVLRQVCRQLKAWRGEGIEDLRVGVNISARQFRQDNLSQQVRQLLAEHEVSGTQLEFELTESMVMQDIDNTLSTLRELKNLGISLALDDFGTGYSSLSYLKRFPIDALKIDRSFIRDIHANPDDAAIAHAVIAMAHSLGLKVVAEGVETEAQLELLRGYQCDTFQGFLFSRPVPAEEFTLMLQRRNAPAPKTA